MRVLDDFKSLFASSRDDEQPARQVREPPTIHTSRPVTAFRT